MATRRNWITWRRCCVTGEKNCRHSWQARSDAQRRSNRLTEDEIEALFEGVDSEDKGRFAIVRGFARAIEAAHGIKGGGNG